MLHHVSYQRAILGGLWLCVMLHDGWPSRSTGSPQKSAQPVPPPCKRKRATAPKAFEGLTPKPRCAACAHEATEPKAPPAPPHSHAADPSPPSCA